MNKILFKLAALAAFLFMSHTMRAEEQGAKKVQYLVVLQTDGTKTEFALEDQPTLSFKDGDVVVASTNKQVTFSMQNVANYHFVTKNVTTGIQQVENTPQSNDEPTFSPADATVSGLKARTRLMVFSINGQLIKTFTAAEDGKVNVNLTDLVPGVYIIKTPTKSFKVMKR